MGIFMKYFKGSAIFGILCLIGAFLLGGWPAVFVAGMLGILETSLSFDNAVVNAKVLQTMSPFWKKIFLTVGMIIAVFGMRIVFPFVIVALVGGDALSGSNIFTDCIEAAKLAITDKAAFQHILVSSHALVAGFGGSFLFMVFLKYFLDSEKETHWVPIIERPVAFFGKIEAVQVAITLVAAFVASKFIHDTGFFMASVWGIVTYILADGIGALLESKEEEMLEEKSKTPNALVKQTFAAGLSSFLYLEVLDASFSFDGVIGAFAVTNDIFIIALGLGIGAMFVRSLTIFLVDAGTLSEYKYLEPAAFYAIGALASIMFISATGIEVPEVVSGLIGMGFIVAGFVHSLLENKNQGK